jgi:hypothetical protein
MISLLYFLREHYTRRTYFSYDLPGRFCIFENQLKQWKKKK